jgi:hypothetical protein
MIGRTSFSDSGWRPKGGTVESAVIPPDHWPAVRHRQFPITRDTQELSDAEQAWRAQATRPHGAEVALMRLFTEAPFRPLVVLHLDGVALATAAHKKNLVASMLTGRKRA